MLFFQKNNRRNPFVESVREPCFVFGGDGHFSYGNAAGGAILELLGCARGRIPESHEALRELLKFYGGAEAASDDISLGSVRYSIQSDSMGGQTLLRLMPVRENERVQHLSSMLDVVPWGLMTLGLQNPEKPMILHCNKRAGELFEVDHHRLVGLYIDDVLRVTGIDQDVLPYVGLDTISYFDHEVRQDGRLFWYRLHFIPYTMGNHYCLIVLEDTTESKIREGQYFQAQRLEALGQLAGGVAHDFNNILSIIDGYARIARKSIEADIPARRYLEHISQAVQRGSALTTQLLTFGRHKVVKDSVVDLGTLVRDQEPLLRPLMDASIALSIRAEDNVYVQVAPDNICQILLNLCINARDAMADGGNLIIEAGQKDNAAYVRIIDTGCGMPPDVKARMFDPFFTTKDQGKGTGLGLSMVYGLVKDMKGDIDVLTKVGEGTAITISLPLSDEKPTAKEITEDDSGQIHFEGFTALVAEDEPDLLCILSSTLEEMGVNVLRASNGNEALTVQDDYDGKIDFLLTDVVMPEMNGVKLAELFESVRPESKILFMSGYPTNNLMTRVKMPDGAVMVPKPVDIDKLSGALRALAANPRGATQDQWATITGQWRIANG